MANDVVVHRRRGGGGGGGSALILSQQTGCLFEGGGKGGEGWGEKEGGGSLDTFTGKGLHCGGGGGGGVRADTWLPLAMGCDTPPPCPSAASFRCPWRAPQVY